MYIITLIQKFNDDKAMFSSSELKTLFMTKLGELKSLFHKNCDNQLFQRFHCHSLESDHWWFYGLTTTGHLYGLDPNAILRVFLCHKVHFIMSKFSVEYFSILSKLFCNLSRYHDFDWQEFAKRRPAKRVVCHNLYLLPSFVTNLTGPGKFVPIFRHFCRFLEWSYSFWGQVAS